MKAHFEKLSSGAGALLAFERVDVEFPGSGNYSNFNRQFKRIKGHGPRMLRRQFQGNGL